MWVSLTAVFATGVLGQSSGSLPLLMSFEASDLALSDGDPVSLWEDSSGSARHLKQSDGGKQPVYKAGDGEPYVDFEGYKYLRTDEHSLGATPWYIVMKCNLMTSKPQPAGFGYILDGYAGDTLSVGTHNSEVLAYAGLGARFTNDAFGTDQVIELVFDGADTYMAIDGGDWQGPKNPGTNKEPKGLTIGEDGSRRGAYYKDTFRLFWVKVYQGTKAIIQSHHRTGAVPAPPTPPCPLRSIPNVIVKAKKGPKHSKKLTNTEGAAGLMCDCETLCAGQAEAHTVWTIKGKKKKPNKAKCTCYGPDPVNLKVKNAKVAKQVGGAGGLNAEAHADLVSKAK